MVAFVYRIVQALVSLTILSSLVSAADPSSPSLAGFIGKQCYNGVTYTGKPKGRNITIGGVATYVTEPPRSSSPKKVILFYSDVFGAFHVNNQLLQDHFASLGFHVVGLDYFLGDPIGLHVSEDFIPFDPNWDAAGWIAKSRAQAKEVLPKWLDAVFKRYGTNAKYGASGYCFGALYSVEISKTDKVVAAAFAHPADLTEEHFRTLGKPMLLSCAENDTSFPPQNLNRAVEILTETKKKYHVQIFSGTVHGFTTRADPNDENAVWARDESARSIAKWFERFGA